MKRVICLYRVSTVGQVDHDDIPMQRLACREYAASHPDWEIVDEISEKGVSGYKISTNARDAIVEIKKRAVLHQFDVLLVFMFDRLGRREDETPFVVQWFVQQGIEVWSTREGEQRFDTHVDKLLNYIRFWQASGESEKTAIRVKTKHTQMVQDGQYRGGLVPYGYKLEHLGRTNKKNQPVKDLVIDEDEAAIVRQIFDLLTNRGYGTNRVAQYLNEKGIRTKRGTSLWRGTSVRALIKNPIYIGKYHMNDVLSESFDNLRIIDDFMFEKCLQTVKGRSTKNNGNDAIVPYRTDSRSLLSGVLYCGHCGSRLCFNHQHTQRMRADGSLVDYEYETYRCYRKISSKNTCRGQTGYKSEALNDAVEQQIRLFLSRIQSVPKDNLVEVASARNMDACKVAYKQAEKDFENIQKQVTALEEEAVKALTGESQLDLGIVNSMLVKHRARLESAQRIMAESKAKMEAETANAKETKAQIDELLSWAECFDKADIETRHMIVARLIERVEVRTGYKVHIKFRISPEQYLGKAST
ncbi:MAG: recombinase family protein [Clostridia bacterium]|nr:recombinase family protein [Clostridia bacterium]